MESTSPDIASSPVGVDLKLLTDVALAFGCELTDPFLLEVARLDEASVQAALRGEAFSTDRSHLTVLSAVGLRMRHLYRTQTSDPDILLANWLRHGPVSTSRGLIGVRRALADRGLAMEVLGSITGAGPAS
jgi:hypothetical protein